MAKIVIVNKNDKVIDSKEREDVNPKIEISRISSLWIINSKHQILLAQRKLTKKYSPGRWGPAVAGTNEAGETYRSNIYKEAKEELGIEEQTFIKGPKLFLPSPNQRFNQVFFFYCDWSVDKFDIQEEEVERIKWFEKNELLDELISNKDNFTASVYEVMQKLKDLL